MKFDDLPDYLQDNEYILDYYRCEWPLKDTLFSVFCWHNETLNIWTHLVGFMIFAAMTALSSMEMMMPGDLIGILLRITIHGRSMVVARCETNGSDCFLPDLANNANKSMVIEVNKNDEYTTTTPIASWPWFVFLAGAMGCLICSSISHLFACHSLRFSLFFWRLDYAGISLMIVGSFFPPLYYVFLCNPLARLFYLTLISLLGVLAIVTLLAPALSAPHLRFFRAALFLTMVFSGVIPAAHALMLHWGDPIVLAATGYEMVVAGLYAVGAGFYVSRVPERWKPGAFDIAGHSHQIFHVFVVAAALMHSATALFIMDWRRGLLPCAGA